MLIYLKLHIIHMSMYIHIVLNEIFPHQLAIVRIPASYIWADSALYPRPRAGAVSVHRSCSLRSSVLNTCPLFCPLHQGCLTLLRLCFRPSSRLLTGSSEAKHRGHSSRTAYSHQRHRESHEEAQRQHSSGTAEAQQQREGY